MSLTSFDLEHTNEGFLNKSIFFVIYGSKQLCLLFFNLICQHFQIFFIYFLSREVLDSSQELIKYENLEVEVPLYSENRSGTSGQHKQVCSCSLFIFISEGTSLPSVPLYFPRIFKYRYACVAKPAKTI